MTVIEKERVKKRKILKFSKKERPLIHHVDIERSTDDYMVGLCGTRLFKRVHSMIPVSCLVCIDLKNKGKE
jgi:hypothetical protein